MKLSHLLLAIGITAIWGINFSVIKLGLHAIDPFILAGLRFTLCAIPALFFIKKPDVPWRYLIGYGLVFGIGLWGLVNLGIKTGLSAGIASLVLQVSAFFTLLLGSYVFKEQLSRYQIAGFVLACSGLMSIVFITDGSVTFAGLLLVLAGAIAWSIANIIMKKAGTKQVFAFLVWSSAFSPLPLFLLDGLINGSAGYSALISHMDTRAILSILFQVYPNTLLGYWIWNSLLKLYPVSTVAPLSLLVPVFGILGSMMIFGEAISPMKIVALVLIITGLAVGLYGQRIKRYFIPQSDSL
ncbi:EamA family transporter (plasmid) [Pantoea dispersa]|uniref:EamA family transporter n=1 Tax=Pantoea dispersa TaxID=59814 RepID=UPI0022216FC4|nr:EamA family transporter [Pantoea dispersa]UYV59708.1 EamA family transporter [Pantoea dispersa]